jgi:hypothetical protein
MMVEYGLLLYNGMSRIKDVFEIGHDMLGLTIFCPSTLAMRHLGGRYGGHPNLIG